MMPPFQPLSGLRVLDVTDSLADTAGEVLLALGASVTKLEPAEGCPSRRLSFGEGTAASGESYYWQAYNAPKILKPMPSGQPGHDGELLALAAASDIILVSINWEYGRQAAETLQAVPELAATLVVIGDTTPDAPRGLDYDELLQQARGGVTYTAGSADYPPSVVFAPLVSGIAGVHAAAIALYAERNKRRNGTPERITVSPAEAAAFSLHILAMSWAAQRHVAGRGAPRVGNGIRRALLWQAADGYVQWTWYVGPGWGRKTQQLVDWIREAGEWPPEVDLDLEVIGNHDLTQEFADDFEAIFARFFRKRTKRELYLESVRRRVVLTPVNTPQDLLEDRQLAARGVFRNGPSGHLESMTWPPVNVIFHSAGAEASGARPEPAGERPLENLRVTDLSWAVAGPKVGELLAFLGSDVVRVESRRRPDSARMTGPFAGPKPGINKSASFCNVNAGKRSVCLNFSVNQGLELVEQLSRDSRIVLENYTPGTAARVGLGFDTLAEQRAGLIYVSLSMQGQTGPHATHPGLGNNLQALCSLDSLTSGVVPTASNALIPDFVSPAFALLGIAAALFHQDEHPADSLHIDVSQLEGILRMVAPALLAAAAGETPQRPPVVPVRCADGDAGEERWVIVLPEPGAAVPAALIEAARGLAPAAVLDRLAAAGFARAAVAQSGKDLLDDPILAARDHYRWTPHMLFEDTKFPIDLPPWRSSEWDIRFRRAPRFGEHTLEILQGELAVSDDRLADLLATGATTLEE